MAAWNLASGHPRADTRGPGSSPSSLQKCLLGEHQALETEQRER